MWVEAWGEQMHSVACSLMLIREEGNISQDEVAISSWMKEGRAVKDNAHLCKLDALRARRDDLQRSQSDGGAAE